MSKEKDSDAPDLEKGAAQLLGLIPYEQSEEAPACQHEDDGHIYGETVKNYILRCYKCGEYYEEPK